MRRYFAGQSKPVTEREQRQYVRNQAMRLDDLDRQGEIDLLTTEIEPEVEDALITLRINQMYQNEPRDS